MVYLTKCIIQNHIQNITTKLHFLSITTFKTLWTNICVSRPAHAHQTYNTIVCNYFIQNNFDISGMMLEITFVYQANRKQHKSGNVVPKSLQHYIIVHYNIIIHYIDGLVQERCNSIANTLELCVFLAITIQYNRIKFENMYEMIQIRKGKDGLNEKWKYKLLQST